MSTIMYDTYREQHKCVTCGVLLEPDYIKVKCPKCIEKAKQYRDENKERIAESYQQRKLYRMENGLCSRCGRPKDDASKRYAECFECRVSLAEKSRQRRALASSKLVEVIRCKDCKYFERDHLGPVGGFPGPIIIAHEICRRWGNGCKTSENGYCYLGERKMSE